MKKILLSLLIIGFIFSPILVNAETQTLDLIDTLESEEITPVFDVDSYSETEDQITIYLFRGNGCIHCRDFLEFLNSITEEYGSKFKLRSYEVYSNSNNQKLKEKITKFFNVEAPGVPFIIIGESTFYGFSESDEENIKSAIDSEYEATEKYDVFVEMEKKESEKNPNDALFVLIPIAGAILIGYLISAAKKEE